MHRIKISAKLIKFPNLCCCCGTVQADREFNAVATRVTGKKVIRSQSKGWAFPICKRCLTWTEMQTTADALKNCFAGVLVATIIAGFIAPHFAVLGGILGFVLLFCWQGSQRASSVAKPAPACATPPVAYDGWEGTVHSFRIANAEFATRFEGANAQKLVS
jgi:hypothetical protein